VPSRRADRALVEAGLAPSVEVARSLIMEGRVYQGERRIDKPGETLKPGAPLTVRAGRPFVSRGARKLLRAFEAFGLDARDRVCLDVGASTGGFTDVMLRMGARRVYAVDVGYGLLDWRLRDDGRVTVMERTNARFLKPEQFPERPCLGATDVSFISLRAVLPAALRVLAGDWRFVALIKPQFEAPRDKVGPRGVVRDPGVHRAVISGIVDFVEGAGFRAANLDFSPITGPKGNVEFLLDIRPRDAEGAASTALGADRIEAVVSAACDKFMKSFD
jgi:23S rRNA (cytidine1920-2'-O)/16S rRNA (cytidine1409-2'-O)-methyltransferase